MVPNLRIRPMTDTPDRPFTDIRALTGGLPPIDAESADNMRKALAPLQAHLGVIGNLEPAMVWLAGWQSRMDITISRPLIAVFAGSQGVAKTVLGQDPAEGARARVKLITQGPAGVRAIASTYGAAFKVFELGTDYPSADMSKEASLSEKDCAAAIAFGMEVVAEGADLLVLGNCGFGSATAAAGIARGLYGGETRYWAGGTAATASARVDAVEAGAKLHADYLGDPLEVLRRFGGRDIAGIVGAILAAGHQRIPVLLDGFVVCAAAAVLHKINPRALDHCFAAHISAEPAHGALLDRLELRPLLDLGIGVGDGTGAALAMGQIKAAAAAVSIITDTV